MYISPDPRAVPAGKASVHDPVVQRAYREFAEHFGFLISPCRPRTPQHKGKVEHGGVHYVCRNFSAGRDFRDIHEANEKALLWCHETAGARIHSTTKERPFDRFEEVERTVRLDLPVSRYAIAVWKQPSSTRTAPTSSSSTPTTRPPIG